MFKVDSGLETCSSYQGHYNQNRMVESGKGGAILLVWIQILPSCFTPGMNLVQSLFFSALIYNLTHTALRSTPGM